MLSPSKQAAAHRAATTLATPDDLADALARALAALLPSLSQGQVERLLRTGNAAEIANAVDWPTLQRQMSKALEGAGKGISAAALRTTSRYLPALDLSPEHLAELADTIAAKHAAEFVTAITKADRLALRDTIRQAVKTPGISRRQLAREIRSQIGLDARQQGWLANKANRWRQEVAEGRMTLAGMNQRIDRQRRRYLRNRSRLIANHEARTIYHRAQMETYREAGVEGAGGVFIGRNGEESSGPPRHINCNCSTSSVIREGVLRIVWVAAPEWCELCDPFAGVVMAGGPAKARRRGLRAS